MNCRTSGSVLCWISSTDPTARTAPSYSIAMRVPTVYALRMSCVITMPVTPSCSRMRTMSASIVAEVTGSSPVVGSSYRMYLGRRAMARAMPTRLRIPPESSAGMRSLTSGRSTSESASSTRVVISDSLSSPCLRKPMATFSPIVMESKSAAN